MWDKRMLRCLMPLLTGLILASSAMAQDPTGRPEGVSPKRRRPAAKEKPKPAPEPITVILTVITDPPMSDVYVNGENRGTSNAEGKWQVSKLPLGQYTIEVRKPGFASATRFFNAGLEAPTVVIRLTPELDETVARFNGLVASGKLSDAGKLYEGVASRFPDRPETARMRIALSERLRERIAPVIPRTLNAWRSLTREELSEALEAAAQLAGLNKEDARAQAEVVYLQGLITFRDWQAGAVASDPSNGGPEQPSGLPGARLDLERAVKLDENWFPAWYHLGGVLLLSGDARGAEGAFVKASMLEPKSPSAHLGLGEAYYAGMKYKEAVAAYERAIELDSHSVRGYAGRGLARAAKGETSAGVKDVEKAMALDPTSALPHLNLGIIYSFSKKDKDLKRAEEELKKAIQLNHRNVEFQNRVAEQLIADLSNRKKRK